MKATALGLMAILIAVAGAAPMARASAPQDAPAAISGVWKLNAEASVNPNGPPAAKPVQRPREGGGGGSGYDPTGGGSKPIEGGIGKEEQQRLDNAKAFFFKAPEMMGVQATKEEFKLLLDPAKNFGFAHKTDNKKAKMTTPVGAMDFKAKWDGQKLVREAELESLKVVETYTVSADGKQLIVTVKADSSMVRNVQTGEIKRVYDKQAQ